MCVCLCVCVCVRVCVRACVCVENSGMYASIAAHRDTARDFFARACVHACACMRMCGAARCGACGAVNCSVQNVRHTEAIGS